MINTEKQGFIQLIKIASSFILFMTIYNSSVLVIEETLGDHIYKVSGQIGSVFGLAVAFFLGFRMNSAYDRWWEARKVLGELTNNSRSFVNKVYVYFGNSKNIDINNQTEIKENAAILINLTVFYVSQFQKELQNNKSKVFNEGETALILNHDIVVENKISNEILIAISNVIESSFSRNANIEKGDLMQHINRFYDIQGKAERIKNTPFLMIYSAFTKIMVNFYAMLIPLFIGDIDLGGEESGSEFLAVPIMVIISTAFLTINKLANLYAEPFSEHKTSVSVNDICNTIIQNLNEVKAKLA